MKLAQRVIAIRADVIECHERSKLGQDERDHVLADIVAGLVAQGDDESVSWIRRFNSTRA